MCIRDRSTEVGAGSHAYMSRVSMLSVSNGLMEIPNDQTLVFEDGVPYLRPVSYTHLDVYKRQGTYCMYSYHRDFCKPGT